jgi:AcrR family transcriptional regulator
MGAKNIEKISTEDRILNAARILFHKKGFAATRTRDIADEAGINLALLNYYFRSKEKLFSVIMQESLQGFFSSITEFINDPDSSLTEKVEAVVENYFLLLKKNPDIPLFVLGELKTNPDELIANIVSDKILMNSVFIKQVQEQIGDSQLPDIKPIHFFINMLGLTIFPFIASPLIKSIGELSDAEFDEMIVERKKLIPLWFNSMLKI